MLRGYIRNLDGVFCGLRFKGMWSGVDTLHIAINMLSAITKHV